MYNVAKLLSRRRCHTSIRCLNKPISKMTMLKHLRKIIGDETLTVHSFVLRCRLGLKPRSWSIACTTSRVTTPKALQGGEPLRKRRGRFYSMRAVSIFTLGRLFGLIGSTLYSIRLTEVHVLTYLKFGAGERAYHEKRPNEWVERQDRIPRCQTERSFTSLMMILRF